MAKLKDDLDAYESMRGDLELEHFGKWVVIHNKKLVGVYDDFQEAAADAVKKYGRGPYVIEQAGASKYLTLPASLQFGPIYG